MKTLLSLSTIAAITATAFAGTASAQTPSSSEPLISGSITAAYETSYYFRGLWFSNNTVFNGVNLSAPLADKLTLGFGALYAQTADTVLASGDQLEYSELDLIGSLSYETDFATYGLVVTNYHFFETFSGEINGATYGAGDTAVKNALDIGLTAKKSFGCANLYLGSWFDTKINAWYFEAGADYTYEVCDKLSLVPMVQMGYGIDYYAAPGTSDGEGLSHVRASLSAPYKLTDAITVTPYVAGNFGLETRRDQNVDEAQNDLFGGISVSCSF